MSAVLGPRRRIGHTLTVMVVLTACGRGAVGETPAQALPAEPVPAVDVTAPAPEAAGVAAGVADGAAVGDEGGLASTVQQQVDDARRVEPPPVPAGAELVAVVGGMPIPRTAFDEIYTLKKKKYADRGREIPLSADRRYRKTIVERLVHHERVRQQVAMLGEDVDPAKAAAQLEQQRQGIDDWSKHLERRGETEASLLALVQTELREELILERSGALAVSRADIEKDYEAIKGNWSSTKPRLRASHILVPIPEAGPGDDPAGLEAAARAKATRIHALATTPGADFAALAREHSTGPSGGKGGDLGIFTLDRMAEEFSNAAVALDVGQISAPVKTKFGFHIIMLIGKWPPGTLPLEALEDQIEERLRQRALHQGRRELKDRLERELPVTHHLLTPEEQERPARRETGSDPTPE